MNLVYKNIRSKKPIYMIILFYYIYIIIDKLWKYNIIKKKF